MGSVLHLLYHPCMVLHPEAVSAQCINMLVSIIVRALAMCSF